jgi:outer membrane protein TolC
VAAAQPPAFPVTLQQAVAHAIEHYPAIVAASARIDAESSGVELTQTAYLPRLDASLQINRATHNNVTGALIPGTLFSGISGPPSDEVLWSSIWGSAFGLLMGWEAFDFGQRGASTALAESLLKRATAGATLTRLEVAVATATAYLQLAAAQEAVRAARSNVERQEVFTTAVSALVANQLRPGADESRARAELALARIQLIQAEEAEQVARASLARWLGVAPGDVQVSHAPLLASSPGTVAPPVAPMTAAPSHPLATTQMANVEAARAQEDIFRVSYRPRVFLQASYWRRGTGITADGTELGGSEGLDFGTPNWALGVTTTFPVFDWFSTRERRRIEAHRVRAESATYDRVVRDLGAQADQARAAMESARKVAENTPVQLASARVLEQQSRARYDAGLATIVEVADAQRLLLQAEVGDALARLGLWQALVAGAAARGDVAELLK